MSWFQPCSFEPLWRYEMVGLLVSLAVYNGATVPLAFPLAIYRKLLGLPVIETSHISDGWPELASGLDALLTWDNGAVQDVFMRTYEFDYEAFGQKLTIDMQRIGRSDPWPGESEVSDGIQGRESDSRCPQDTHPLTRSSSAYVCYDDSSDVRKLKEAGMVTNENRAQYVQDYIFWLTDKMIRRQYEAFARGFYTCLDRKAVSVSVIPSNLQNYGSLTKGNRCSLRKPYRWLWKVFKRST